MHMKLRTMMTAICLFMMSLSTNVSMASTIEERPSGAEMVADVILVRPLMLIATMVGTGAYVVSLPATLLGGNSEEAGKKLVVTPFKATFLRCLGCTKKHAPDAEYY